MPNKKLIIISEKLDIQKYLNYINDNTTVIGWNQEVCQELERRKIKYKPITVKYNENIGVKWIKNLAKKDIFDNKNLISIFEFKGTSLWWWMEYWLYVSFVYYDSFNEIIKVFYIIYNIIKEEKPDEIVYVKEGMLYDKTIKLIAEKFGIKTKRINSYLKLVQFKVAKKIKMILIKNFFDIRFILRKIILSFVLKIQKKKRIDKIGKNNILFIYGCSPRAKDYVEPILEKLRKTKYNIYALDISEGKEFLDLKVFKEKIKDVRLNHILLEDHISRKNIKEINKINKKLKTLWTSLKKKKKFRQLFELNGINIWALIEPQFSCCFDIRLKNHLINFVGIDNVVKSINPDIAITPEETTEFDKGLFLACQKRKVPSIAIQHGLLNDLRCIHGKNEISLRDIKPEYCPIPTITTVYGNDDKEFLINKGNYPEDSVVVTGNQRYDPLAYADKMFDKEEICKKLKLDPNKKIVVLATGLFSSIKETEIFIKIVCDAIKKIKDVQLIVKVHPEETIKFYDKLTRANKMNALITKYDIFKVLYICNVLLTVNSTVGLEAAILNKPIITINFRGNQDLVDYAKEGVAIGVYDDVKDLTKAIKNVLYDKKTRDKLTRNRRKYVYEHCYKIDGKASERIACLIEDTIKIKQMN